MTTENLNSVTDIDRDEVSLKELIFNLKDWLGYIFSKWAVLLSVGVLGAILGITYAHFKDPVYTATTSFVLESGDSSGGLGQYAGIASMVGLDIGAGGGLFQGDNIIELYKSRTMIEKALLSEVAFNGKNILLIDRYIEFNKLRTKWDKQKSLKGISFHLNSGKSFNRLQDSLIGTIVFALNKSCLSVSKPDKKLSILKVHAKSSDEFFAKKFNDEIVKNVSDFFVQTKTKKSLQNVQIIQQKVDSVRKVMNSNISTSAAIVDATPNLNPTRQGLRAAPVQKSQFSAETNKAILSELIKNLEISKISLRKETPLIQLIDEPVFPLEKDSLSHLKGFVLGGFLFGVFAVIILSIKRKLL